MAPAPPKIVQHALSAASFQLYPNTISLLRPLQPEVTIVSFRSFPTCTNLHEVNKRGTSASTFRPKIVRNEPDHPS